MKIIKRLGSALVVVVLLAACSDVSNDAGEELPVAKQVTTETEAEKKAKAEADAIAKAEAEEEAKVDAQMKAAKQLVLEQEVLALYQKNMGMVDISYDEAEKSFNMIPTDPAFIEEIYATFTGRLDVSHWNELVDSFVTMSMTQQKNLGSGYRIALFNPANTENIILAIIDGVVYFDAFNE